MKRCKIVQIALLGSLEKSEDNYEYNILGFVVKSNITFAVLEGREGYLKEAEIGHIQII